MARLAATRRLNDLLDAALADWDKHVVKSNAYVQEQQPLVDAYRHEAIKFQRCADEIVKATQPFSAPKFRHHTFKDMGEDTDSRPGSTPNARTLVGTREYCGAFVADPVFAKVWGEYLDILKQTGDPHWALGEYDLSGHLRASESAIAPKQQDRSLPGILKSLMHPPAQRRDRLVDMADDRFNTIISGKGGSRGELLKGNIQAAAREILHERQEMLRLS
ncbi:MAG TPA: hypothetical protein VFR09_08100, partial [Alphaproteobacteria bacterium]|nr:hypothetical protein [Alphaproteobacteria bacterium]